MEAVSFSARVIPKRAVLIPEVADRHYIVVETSENSLEVLRQYAADHNMQHLRVTFEEYPDDWTERAKNFMFLIRDRLAESQGDTSKENKDLLYQNAKFECGYHKSDGTVLSLKNLSRTGVSNVIDKLLDWAAEEGLSLSEFQAERAALKEMGDE